MFVVCLPVLLELRNPQSGRLKKVSVPCLVYGGEKQEGGWRRTQVSDLVDEGYDAPKEDHDGNYDGNAYYF